MLHALSPFTYPRECGCPHNRHFTAMKNIKKTVERIENKNCSLQYTLLKAGEKKRKH
jgi:hypothetical protein